MKQDDGKETLPARNQGRDKNRTPEKSGGIVSSLIANPALLLASVVAAPLILILWGLTGRKGAKNDDRKDSGNPAE